MKKKDKLMNIFLEYFSHIPVKQCQMSRHAGTASSRMIFNTVLANFH